MKAREFWILGEKEMESQTWFDACSIDHEKIHPNSNVIHVREVKPIPWEKIWEEYHKYKHNLDADNKNDQWFLQELVEKYLSGDAIENE